MVEPSSLCSERVCFMRAEQRNLLVQASALQVETWSVARRGGARSREGAGREKVESGRRNHPRQIEGRRMMRMSFDIHEAVFDEQGTYLEEKAVRYGEALMEQFAASRSVTSD
jgi:hypothetical protein